MSPPGSPTDIDVRHLIGARAEPIVVGWRTRLSRVGGSYGRGLAPEPELLAEMHALLGGLVRALESDDARFDTDPDHPLAQALRAASEVRATRGFTPEESVLFLQTCKESLIDVLHGEAFAPAVAHAATLRIERLLDRCVLVLVSAFIATRDELARRQSESLREVSTPVIMLWDSVLLLPLVGIVDSVRAQLIAERLLEAISRTEAEVTLIDVTGVPVMDTAVARHLLRTIAAAGMLGTRVVLTGIGPTNAQTMVKLGIDMAGVPTRGSLKSGLALAMSMTGRRVTDASPAVAGR